MAVPTPADADAATVRVRLVADMLLKKSQEVQSKGNAGAALSLSESAADLQRAAALLHELARLVHLPPPRLRSDSDASFSSIASTDGTSSLSSLSLGLSGSAAHANHRSGPPAASASVKDLVSRLGRVDAMLGKKSDEMRHKGNENAAHALHQSALAVRLGAQHITEQQLMTRTLVVTARALREQLREHCRVALADEEVTDETTLDDELMRRALDSARALRAIHGVLRDLAPTTTTADELRTLLQRILLPSQEAPASLPSIGTHAEEIGRLSAETTRLQWQLEETHVRYERDLRDANDARESMRTQCEALEKALEELEAEYHDRRERELDHLNALHERQKGTHEELKKLLLAKEEEVTSLKIQADAWMNQLTQQQETLADLRDQREQDHQFHARQVSELREQLHARDTEVRAVREELSVLHQQLKEEEAHREQEHPATATDELRQQLEAVQTHRDMLLVEREDSLAATEEAELRVDIMRKEFQTRLEESDRSMQAAEMRGQERDARIAELEALVAVGADHTDVVSDDKQHTQKLADEVVSLRRELDQNVAKHVALEQQHEQTSASLVAVQNELRERTSELVLLREEHAERSANASELTVRALEQDARGSEMEAALAQQRSRVEELETELEEKGLSLARLTTAGDATEQAIKVVQAALTATSQQLHDVQYELTTVREESAVLNRELLLVAQDVCVDDDSLTESATSIHALSILHQRCTELLTELRKSKMRCEELIANREVESLQKKDAAQAEVNVLQTQLEELRATISQLQQEKSMLETKYNALVTTKEQASSEANGVEASESEVLRTKLLEVETEFERYRTRSHAALKKVEKRAELLNSMRKENERLTQAMEELTVAYDAAMAKEQIAAARLDEVTRTIRKQEDDAAQELDDARAKLEEAESKCAALTAANADMQQQYDDAVAKVAVLQQEKEDLSHAKHAVHEQALELKDAELDESEKRLKELQAAIDELEEKVRDLEETTTQREEQITLLESERQGLQDAAELASRRVEELEQSRDELTARMEALTSTLEQTQGELAALEATRDVESEESQRAAVAHSVIETEARQNAQEEEVTQLRAQLQAATRETEELTARLVEIQLTKVATEQEAEDLRTQVMSLQSELAKATVSTEGKTEDAVALQQSQDAKIGRLLDEIEMMTRRQIDDQRTIAELKEQLSKSEQNQEETRKQLRIAENQRQTAHTAEAEAQAATIQTLRERIEALQAPRRSHTESDDHDVSEEDDVDTSAPRNDSDDLTALQASRQAKREQDEQEAETANRKVLVAEYLHKTADVVRELQQSMDDYSSVFRDACALREDVMGDGGGDGEELNGHGSNADGDAGAAAKETDTDPNPAEYEEYLTLTSGVVVKAGATFSLPVYCDKPGWRVEWKFAVKEDGADVGFALSVETTTEDGARTRETIVTPARVHSLSGVYDASASTVASALCFEWDNAFSWLNEKTLDYHVSVMEPLSDAKKALRLQERSLQADITVVDTQLALLHTEKERRIQLEHALQHVQQCADEKDTQLRRFTERRTAIQQAKATLQVRMEDLQTQLRSSVRELDELATSERDVAAAWEALQSEHEDVDMTMRLSANSRLDELLETLATKKERLDEALQTVATALAQS